MKNRTIIKLLFMFTVVPVFFGSCNLDDFLEKPPGVDHTEDMIFSTKRGIESYLYGTYTYGLHSYYPYYNDNRLNQGTDKEIWANPNPNQSMTAFMTDEGEMSGTYFNCQQWNSAIIQANDIKNQEDKRFDLRWIAIRRCNTIIERMAIDEVLTPEERDQFTGEALFIRALNNFEMFKRYGGMPIVDRKLEVDDDQRIPRANLETFVNYIVGDCDESARLLKDVVYTSAQRGRITNAAALALKARTLLYAASPLFNTATPYISGTPEQNALVCYGDESQARWAVAAQAADTALIEASKHGFALLNTGNPEEDYRSTWNTNDNVEIILAEKYKGRVGHWQVPYSLFVSSLTSAGSWGPSATSCVTHNFVRKYEKKNGQAQTWNEVGVVGSDLMEKYAELDPRFKQTVAYQGSIWTTLNGQVVVQVHEGGAHDNFEANRTGLFMQKDQVFIDMAFAVTPYLLYAGLTENNTEYIDYAVFETLELFRVLKDAETGLLHQGRGFVEKGKTSEDNWSRGNGWGALAMGCLLRDLPKNHPQRKEVERQGKEFFLNLLKYQDENGLWHQEITEHTSYVETSGSGLVLYGLGLAIESGVLSKKYRSHFEKGLRGLAAYVDTDGSVSNGCWSCLCPNKGTKEDYINHPWFYNESHAFGPVVLAFAQAVKMGISEISLENKVGSMIGVNTQKQQPRTYVRYVPERSGDIAWENDRIAFRIYSQEVKAKVSSGVDIWTKSVDYPVIDHWYDLNAKKLDYHTDRGEGYDFYNLGFLRGCGGTAVWKDGTLFPAETYANYRIYKNEKDEIEFELSYLPYRVNGVTVYEKKKIRMVMGTNFFQVESTFETDHSEDLVVAVGITGFGSPAISQNKETGTLSVVEQISKKDGMLGTAVFADPAQIAGFEKAGNDHVVLLNVKSNQPFIYYAGAGWSGNPKFISFGKWQDMVDDQSWEKLNNFYSQYLTTTNTAMNKKEINTINASLMNQGNKFASINLTVAEGKRLIAKGIANHPLVKEKMRKGMIIVTKGTTNTYIAEELAAFNAPRGSFMTGHITPEKSEAVNGPKSPELILIDGVQSDISYADALKLLKKGDIVMKGGNMLNYERQQAAVCIGAPDGGTTYKLLPFVGEDKAQLIIPIGLEKEVFGDLTNYEAVLNQDIDKENYIPKLHLFKEGTIFTEIEALKVFADITVFPYASGGIKGREGGISLVVSGKEENVLKILEIIKDIQGEPPFIQ